MSRLPRRILARITHVLPTLASAQDIDKGRPCNAANSPTCPRSRAGEQGIPAGRVAEAVCRRTSVDHQPGRKGSQTCAKPKTMKTYKLPTRI